MFDLLNQWSKPMVFLAVLLTGVIRPAHGLFCLFSYFVGIYFAKLVRQVKGQKKNEIIANKDAQPGTRITPAILKNIAKIVIINEKNETTKPKKEEYKRGL